MFFTKKTKYFNRFNYIEKLKNKVSNTYGGTLALATRTRLRQRGNKSKKKEGKNLPFLTYS
jgi:hypothetical protein